MWESIGLCAWDVMEGYNIRASVSDRWFGTIERWKAPVGQPPLRRFNEAEAMPDEQTTLRLCTSWCHWTAELVKESQMLPYERNSRWRLPWRIHARGFPLLYDVWRAFPGNYGDGIVDHNTGSGKTLRMIRVCDNYFLEARAVGSLLRMLTGKWCPRHAARKLMLQESFAQGSIEVLEAQNDPKVAKATATTSGTSSNWTACGYLRALWTFASIPIVLVLVLVGYTKDTTARADINNVPICSTDWWI